MREGSKCHTDKHEERQQLVVAQTVTMNTQLTKGNCVRKLSVRVMGINENEHSKD